MDCQREPIAVLKVSSLAHTILITEIDRQRDFLKAYTKHPETVRQKQLGN